MSRYIDIVNNLLITKAAIQCFQPPYGSLSIDQMSCARGTLRSTSYFHRSLRSTIDLFC